MQARPTLLAEADASVVQVPPRLNPETSPAPSTTSVPARSCVQGRCWPVVIAVCVHSMLPVSNLTPVLWRLPILQGACVHVRVWCTAPTTVAG